MVSATGTRIGWVDLPAHVQAAVARFIGAPVVEAVSQPGGFSPGAGGAPRLLGFHDGGEWVALVLEDVDGQHPAIPWEVAELSAVLDRLAALATVEVPADLLSLRPVAEALALDLAGWERLAADRPKDLDPWVVDHLDELVERSRQGLLALRGDRLVHCDVRADNLLIDAGGHVTMVDWPWAGLGASWFDPLALILNVNVYGGYDPDALQAGHPTTSVVDPLDVTAVLAGVTGYFLDAARRPVGPDLPTLREFQRFQGEATLRWLRTRIEADAPAAFDRRGGSNRRPSIPL
jgi:Phosphotransferase enzyme family